MWVYGWIIHSSGSRLSKHGVKILSASHLPQRLYSFALLDICSTWVQILVCWCSWRTSEVGWWVCAWQRWLFTGLYFSDLKQTQITSVFKLVFHFALFMDLVIKTIDWEKPLISLFIILIAEIVFGRWKIIWFRTSIRPHWISFWQTQFGCFDR